MTEYQLLQLLLRGSKLKVVHEECQFSNAGNNELPCFNYWMFLLLIYQYDLLVFRILLFTAKQKVANIMQCTNLLATPSSTVLKGKGSNYSFQICQAKFYKQHLLQKTWKLRGKGAVCHYEHPKTSLEALRSALRVVPKVKLEV